jgi:hypothetical protein
MPAWVKNKNKKIKRETKSNPPTFMRLPSQWRKKAGCGVVCHTSDSRKLKIVGSHSDWPGGGVGNKSPSPK